MTAKPRPKKKRSNKKPKAGAIRPKRRSKATFVLHEESPIYKVANGDLVTLEQAANLTGKTTHNIRDYIQRNRIAKLDIEGRPINRAVNGELRVSLKEVRAFLHLVSQRDEEHHHAGLHPELGFYGLAERERT